MPFTAFDGTVVIEGDGSPAKGTGMSYNEWRPGESDQPLRPGEEDYYGGGKIREQRPFYRRHVWKIVTGILAILVIVLLSVTVTLFVALRSSREVTVVQVQPTFTSQAPTLNPTPTAAPVAGILQGAWIGQGTYNVGRTPFDMLLTITGVNGNTFAGTLEEDIYFSTVSVSGTVTGSFGNSVKITFTDNSPISGNQIVLNCTYIATVSNGQMSGFWSYPGDASSDGTLSLSKQT